MIRHAVESDLQAIKELADNNRKSLGFIKRAELETGLKHNWILVAIQNQTLTGFAHYRHRKDEQTTVYQICISDNARGNGFGKSLIQTLEAEAKRKGKTKIVLKCPSKLTANSFYKHLGFIHKETAGYLNIWELPLI